MLGDHLEEMIRRGVRYVMVAIVVIAIVMLIMVKHHFIRGGMNIVVMSLREEMVANVTRLKDEQQRHQHPQPPARRSWLGRPSGRLSIRVHQLLMSRRQNLVRLILTPRGGVKLFPHRRGRYVFAAG